ncbi:MAG: exonuclease SbcCD subunit D [Thermoleophilia bacterium]|nr:exonuclease SbcCD subunit D [Thermoleophilia bacterium]
MRLLHTGDWHLGKRLYGLDRRDEAVATLAELARIALSERVDAVLVAGDLLDRRVNDYEPLGDCLNALEELARAAPVLAVVGNHDDERLWGALARYLAERRIHLASRIAPAERGVVSVETDAGPLHAGLMPWPDPRAVADEIGLAAADTKRGYADGVRSMMQSYGRELVSRRAAQGGAAVLVAHAMVDGAVGGGGEREMTMGITYAVSPHAMPSGLDYIALGHVHRPQAVPGVAVPARYAGSPMPIDFSEDNHAKTACVVDVDGDHTTVREIPLTTARPLVRLRAPLESLAEAAAERPGGWYLCEVLLDEPVLDLVRQVRERVPDTLRVEPHYAQVAAVVEEGADEDAAATSVADQYAAWYSARGRALPDAQARAFAQALEAAEAAGDGA